MNEVISKATEASLNSAYPLSDGDYVDSDTGLLTCHVCGESKRKFVDMPGCSQMLVGIPCKCEREKKEAEELKKKREKSETLRRDAFGSVNTKRFGYTFENDDGQNIDVTRQLKLYCDNFAQYRKDGCGLLLYSQKNGSGKTFMACAVANRLIDEGYNVRVTDFMELRDGMFKTDKNEFLRSLRRFALIVIDDLGTENGGDYMLETEYRIINDLTENYVPLILTTNYTPKELTECSDRAKRRIYDRVLSCCVPIKIDPPNGSSRRISQCKNITADFRKMLEETE